MKSKSFKSVLILLGLSILGTGCSSSPEDDYQTLTLQNTAPVFEAVEDILLTVKAGKMPLGKFQKAEIRVTKPVMKLENVLSNFMLFETEKLSIGSYSLDAGSGCFECIGFRKKTILPYVLLFNSEKNEVTAIDKTSKVGFGYNVNKLFNVLEEDSYYILIAADNRALGRSFIKMARGHVNGGTISVPMPVQLGPEGDIFVTVSKIE